MQVFNDELDGSEENDGSKIRESFEQQFQKNAPLPDLWGGISDALQKADGAPLLNPVANAFHDHYLAESQSPKSRKNVADAWQVVQAQLPKPKRKLQKYMAVLLLLLLLRQCSQGVEEAANVTQALATINSDNLSLSTKVEPKNTKKIEPKKQPISRPIKIDSDKKTIATNANTTFEPVAFEPIAFVPKNKQNTFLTTENKAILDKKNTTINTAENMVKKTADFPLLLAIVNPKTPLDSSVPTLLPIDLAGKRVAKKFEPSVEVAFSAAANTSLFYGELSKKAFDPNSSNSTNFRTALQLSLQGRYYFSPKQAISVELMPMVTYKQNFGEYSPSGQYIKRSLQLVYRQVGIGYQYQIRADKGQEPKFRTGFLQAAAQVGYLSESRETISFRTAPSYKKMKYGLSLAIGQKHSFQKRSAQKLSLSYGVAVSLSLNNISEDSPIRLFSFSPFVAVGYQF